MTKIGLISDTHSYLDNQIFEYFNDCDEIWHSGDWGNLEIANNLKNNWDNKIKKPIIKGVFGNIDANDIKNEFPEIVVFMCEEIKVMIKHIGGYPPNYNAATKKELAKHKPQLFITGHSHILKIMFDDTINCLHINPGAAGKQGWHKVRTLVKIDIDTTVIKNCQVIELMPR